MTVTPTLSDLGADHDSGSTVDWRGWERDGSPVRGHSSCQGEALASPTRDVPVGH